MISVKPPLESQEYTAIVHWCKLHKIYIIHIPNEGKRTGVMIRRNYLASQGLVKGVADFFLPIPIRSYHGLWLEVKRNDKYARMTADQIKFLKDMKEKGYEAKCGKGFDECIKIIQDYMAVGDNLTPTA